MAGTSVIPYTPNFNPYGTGAPLPGGAGPQYVQNENPLTNGSLYAQAAQMAGSGGAAPAVESTLAEQAAGAGLNRAGRLLLRLGIPEEFLGAAYKPGGWIGLGASLAGKPIGNMVGGITGDQQTGNEVGDTIQYAGMGAGLGSMVGPWGTAAGALAGGAYGLWKGLHDKPQEAPAEKAFKSMGAMGLDSQTLNSVRDQYDRLKAADPQMADAWLAGVQQQAMSSFMQGNGNPFASQTPEQNLVLQQLAGQAMAPYVQDMRTNINQATKALTDNIGNNLSPQQQNAIRPLVQQYASLSKNIGDAYALQAEAFPIMNQLSKSSWANMIQSAAGGSGGSLTSLLAQQAANSGALK